MFVWVRFVGGVESVCLLIIIAWVLDDLGFDSIVCMCV